MDGRTALLLGIGLVVLMVAPIGVREWWRRHHGWHVAHDPGVGERCGSCAIYKVDRKGRLHVRTIDHQVTAAPPRVDSKLVAAHFDAYASQLELSLADRDSVTFRALQLYGATVVDPHSFVTVSPADVAAAEHLHADGYTHTIHLSCGCHYRLNIRDRECDWEPGHWSSCSKHSPTVTWCPDNWRAPQDLNDGDPRTSGPGFKLTMHDRVLDEPLHWRTPRMVFVDSMSDLFHHDVTDDFIARVFAVMASCQQHTFQILTKRSKRMATLLASDDFAAAVRRWYDVHDVDHLFDHLWEAVDDAWPLPNVWLGVSIENDSYTYRADHLRATPAAVRFVSAEPLLGPLPSLDLTAVDWLIVGGESGPNARPMHPQWARDLRDQCNHHWPTPCLLPDAPLPHPVGHIACAYPDPVAFFFKQHGAWRPVEADEDWRHVHLGHVNLDGSWHDVDHPGPLRQGAQMVVRVGKKKAGSLLDGREWHQYPTTRSTTG